MTESARTHIVRVIGMFLGVTMLIVGPVFIVLSITGEMRPMDGLMGGMQLYYGWWFVSSGLGWHSPFRREATRSTDE